MKVDVHISYFTALAKLAESDQKQAKRFLSKLEQDETTKGLNVEKINNSAFVSLRASKELRAIGLWVGEVLTLHHIGHHDAAYAWADKHKLLAELKSGVYRLVADDVAEATVEIRASPLPFQDKSVYGKTILDQLINLGFPEYIARSLETTCNEDELYERLGVLPDNLGMAMLEAILYGVSYEAILDREIIITKKIASLIPEEKSDLAIFTETHEETKLIVSSTEASIIVDTDTSKHLVFQENQSQNEPSDVPSIYGDGKIELNEAVLGPILEIAPATELVALNIGDLRVERVQDANGVWWLLQIYDGDTFIGSYEQSKTEDGAKEKEVEILWPDQPELRKCANDELRRAYQANGERPFIVRWNGDVVGREGKKGVKQIKNKETSELLGEFPRCCFRK